MIILITIICIVLIIAIIGRYNLSRHFVTEVKTLFAQSKPISGKYFSYEQLAGLPEPVQKYFKLVLKEGQPYISYMRMTHGGQFKTGASKNWGDIVGEHYASTAKPGFIWKGSTTLFTARDMYVEDKGRLVVSIFGLFNVVNGTGKEFDQGELLRWLGESVLYPTNLLPSDHLQWSAINERSAKLTYEYQGVQLFYIASFNDAGEICQLGSKRYMDKVSLETWIIKPANYKKINNIIVPTFFEVLWRLKKGDLSYAKFNVQKIEYDKPQLF